MIRISGTASVDVDWEIELDMTEEEFDNLSEGLQNELIDSNVDWLDACRNGSIDNIEVDVIEHMEA